MISGQTGGAALRAIQANQTSAFLFVSLLITVPGCAPMKMTLPPAIKSRLEATPVDRPAIQGAPMKQTWRIGKTTTDVRTGFISKEKPVFQFGINFRGPNHYFQDIEFTIQEGQAKPLSNQCTLERASMKEHNAGWTITEKRAWLTCGLLIAGSQAITLQTDEEGLPDHRIGRLVIGGTVVAIVPVYNFEGSQVLRSTPTGFLFQAGEQTLGAVDVCNKGVVYIDKAQPAPTQTALMAASIALLIYSRQMDPSDFE